MITERTILILGAGASADYGYPLGQALVDEICRNLKSPLGNLFGQDLMMAGVSEIQLRDFGLNMEAAQATSVDGFLEHRRDLEKVGKLAIARALIPHEEAESFRGAKYGDSYSGWYQYLFDALNAGPKEFGSNKLAIITFNYDRSLEHFLYTMVKNKYGVSEERAAELTHSIEIIHLHGMLSPLKFLSSKGRQYSPAISTEILLDAAANIKIVHEDVHHSPEFQKAVEWLGSAEQKTVCFLGFGYHATNLERLKMRMWGRANVFCSRCGITDAELEQVKRRMPQPLDRAVPILWFHYGDKEDSKTLPYLRSIGVLPLT
jgi:hypothetical protein